MRTDHRILVVFHSAEGHTATVADRLAEALRAGGAQPEVVDARRAPGPGEFDAVVVGDSIHGGRHSREVTAYLRRHAATLAERPWALFQVSLTSATDDPEHAERATAMATALAEQTGTRPDAVGLFAGAIAYTRYGRLKRRMMRSIAAQDGLPTDTRTDHDLTDWHAVDEFGGRVLALLETAPAR